MGFLNLFGGGMEQGLATFRETPGAMLLDVRETYEYAEGHIPGAINVPLGTVGKVRYPVSTPLFVYCLSGARSAQARRILQQMGYEVTDLGGIGSYRGQLER